MVRSADCDTCGERIMLPPFPLGASWVHTTPNVWTRHPIHRAWPVAPDGMAWPTSAQAQILQTIGPVSPDDIAWADSEATDTTTEPDLSDCPYYRSWQEGSSDDQGGDGDGKCNRGCHDEPHCITDEPTEGWPSRRATDNTATDDPWTLHGEARATLRADGEREERR